MDGLKDETRAYLTHQQRHLLLAEPIARLSLERRVIFRDDPAIAELDVQYLALSAMDFAWSARRSCRSSTVAVFATPAATVGVIACDHDARGPLCCTEQDDCEVRDVPFRGRAPHAVLEHQIDAYDTLK